MGPPASQPAQQIVYYREPVPPAVDPPPTREDPAIAKAKADEALRQAAMRGRASTIKVATPTSGELLPAGPGATGAAGLLGR